MPFDKFVDIDKIDDDRRTSVMKSIRTVNVEELKKLADEIFHSPDDPCRQTLLALIAENPGATFYHADAGEGVMFLYSRDIDKGLWYLSGNGMGPLSARARQMMKKQSKASSEFRTTASHRQRRNPLGGVSSPLTRLPRSAKKQRSLKFYALEA